MSRLLRRTPPDPHCLVAIGDSNSRGQGDDNATSDGLPYGIGGFPERACILAGVPSARAAAGGTALGSFVGVPEYWEIVAAMGATIASVALGTNRGLETGAQLAAKLQIVVDLAADAGLLVIACTIPPTLDFGDPDNGDNERMDANDLIRAGLSSVAWSADLASGVEGDDTGVVTLNGGWWRSTGGVNPYGNDLHYSSLGHAAAAVVLADAITNVIAGNRGGLSQHPDLS